MKNFKKAFTLVEMLIVVVIIGILSSALLPRLQGAQAAARDAARKSDLSQLWSAILQYYNNRGEYPDGSWTSASNWNMIDVSNIWDRLVKVVELSAVPTDPNRKNAISWDVTSANHYSWSQGQYGYAMMKKNTIDDWWYVLAARTETEWGSNFLSSISLGDDISNFQICTKFKSPTAGDDCSATTTYQQVKDSGWECCYTDKSEFLYLYVF